MSQYFNKDIPYFDSVSGAPLPFGKVYFGQPNTDPLDQDNNAKAPYTDRELTTPADSLQIMDIAGKLQDRLYLSGAYAIAYTDADDNVIESNPYYVGESTDQIVNDSTVTGATLTDALDELLARIEALEDDAVGLSDIWNINGNLYMTASNENPGSRLGFGTWAAYGQGRLIMGVGTGTDSNTDQLTVAGGDEGGVYNVTLTEAEIPEHEHFMFGGNVGSVTSITGAVTVARTQNSTGNNQDYVLSSVSGDPENGSTSAFGGADAHTNVPPYIAVYLWRRTA